MRSAARRPAKEPRVLAGWRRRAPRGDGPGSVEVSSHWRSKWRRQSDGGGMGESWSRCAAGRTGGGTGPGEERGRDRLRRQKSMLSADAATGDMERSEE
jgi:hypothetical protein